MLRPQWRKPTMPCTAQLLTLVIVSCKDVRTALSWVPVWAWAMKKRCDRWWAWWQVVPDFGGSDWEYTITYGGVTCSWNLHERWQRRSRLTARANVSDMLQFMCTVLKAKSDGQRWTRTARWNYGFRLWYSGDKCSLLANYIVFATVVYSCLGDEKTPELVIIR